MRSVGELQLTNSKNRKVMRSSEEQVLQHDSFQNDGKCVFKDF